VAFRVYPNRRRRSFSGLGLSARVLPLPDFEEGELERLDAETNKNFADLRRRHPFVLRNISDSDCVALEAEMVRLDASWYVAPEGPEEDRLEALQFTLGARIKACRALGPRPAESAPTPAPEPRPRPPRPSDDGALSRQQQDLFLALALRRQQEGSEVLSAAQVAGWAVVGVGVLGLVALIARR